MSLARTVAWNTAVQLGGRAFGLVASMAFTRIILDHLGLATFGQFVAASAYIGLFQVLGESGLYLVSVRRAAQETERRAAILGTALGLRLLWSLPPLLLAILVAQLIPSERFPTYAPVVKLAVAVLALNAYITLLNQFLAAIFRIHLRMDLAVIGEVGSRVVQLGAAVLVVLSNGGLIAVLLAVTSASFTNLLYAWIVTRRFETFKPELDPQLAREFLRDAIVLAIVIVLGLLRQKIDVLLLSVLQSAEDVGVYGVAMKVHEVLISFPGLFVQLLFPVYSRLAVEDELALQRIFQRAFDVLLLAAIGIALALVTLAPVIADLLGAPEAARPLRVLALALPAAFSAMGFSFFLLAQGKQKIIVRLYGILVLVNLGLNWMAIPRYSYMGAATVTLVTEFVALVGMASYWVLARRMSLSLRSAWAIPIAVLLAGLLQLAQQIWAPPTGSGIMLQLLALLSVGIVSTALYAAAVFALGLLPLEVLRSLLKRKPTP